MEANLINYLSGESAEALESADPEPEGRFQSIHHRYRNTRDRFTKP